MALLSLLIAAAAAASPTHWERLPAPPGGLRDVDVGTELVARSPDGAVFAWRQGWVALAPATATSRAATALAAGRDGSVWVYEADLGVAQRFAGAWGPREALPVVGVTDLVVEPDGTAWVSGLFGRAGRRDAEGWSTVDGMGSAHLKVLADPTGGVWFLAEENGGEAHHRGRGADRTVATGIAHWSTSPHSVDVTPRGEPERTEGLALASAGSSRWEWLADGVRHGDDRLVLPVSHDRLTPLGLWVLDDGSAVVWATGGLFRSREGSAPQLAPASGDWSTARFGTLVDAVAADLDGDGLKDLYAERSDGRLVLLLQTEGGWTDVSDRNRRPIDLSAGGLLAACDVDGDGRDDLIHRIETPGGAAIHLSRAQWGSNTGGTGLEIFGGLEANSRVHCADVDGDGDPDLLIAGGGFQGPERRVAVLLNDGLGRLTPVALPERGLGHNQYTARVLPADLDGDGDLDLVLANNWGRGHGLLERRDADFADRSMGSGLDTVYEVPAWSWLADVDGDGPLDLVTAGEGSFRVWQGLGGFRFEDRTAAWRPGRPPAGRVQWLLEDLDQDGHPDLLGASDPPTLWVGGPEGFSDRSAALPAQGASSWVAVDLHGDGDLDLVGLGPSPVTWENRGVGTPHTGPVWRSSPVWRRAAWIGWLDLGLGLLVVLAWGTSTAATRRSGSRTLLGNPLGAALALALATAVWGVGLEAPEWVRVTSIGVLSAGLLALGRAEAVAHRRRTARRVGSYQLGALLGRGGMGTVYLATDLESGALVALKLVHPDLLSTEAELAMYRREAQLGARIDDPHVVRILGFGEHNAIEGARPRTTAYLVMEFLDGGTLRDLLRSEGQLDPGPAAALVRQVALGLDAVHAAGVVHRDVKPDNIALPRGGVAKLMDFGAAARLSATATASDVLGTLGYLAPEQARGLPPTAASDLYALGVVLYELLSGHRPHDGADIASLLSRVLASEVPPLERPDVPDELAVLLARMLSREPGARPTAAQVAKALEPHAVEVGWTVPSSRAALPSEGGPTVRSHVGNVLALLRLYYAYFRDGGQADLGEFALRLLTAPRSSDVAPTRRSGDVD